MKFLSKRFWVAILASAICLTSPLAAQVAETRSDNQAAAASVDATPDLTLADVEAALKAMEADSGIEDSVKNLLKSKYTQAMEAVKAAQEHAAQAAKYRDSANAAPPATAKLQAELESLATVQEAAQVEPKESTEAMQKEIDSRRGQAKAISDELAKYTAELPRVKGRPPEISVRLKEAQRELADLKARLMSPEFAEDVSSPSRVADRLLLRARGTSLRYELEALKQEQLTQAVREEYLQAQLNLLTRQYENDAAALDSLTAMVNDSLAREAESVRWIARNATQGLPTDDPAVDALATEVQSLAREFVLVVETLKKTSKIERQISEATNILTSESEAISSQAKLGVTGGAMARVLFELRNRLEYARANALRLTASLPAFDQTRLDAFVIEDSLRKQTAIEQRFADQTEDPAVARVIKTCAEILTKLKTQYETLVGDLAALDVDTQAYLDKITDVHDEVSEQLFWMRSYPPISQSTIGEIPEKLRRVLNREYWVELVRAMRAVVQRMPMQTALMLLAAVGLWLARPRILAALEQTGSETRRISSDHYALSIRACNLTVLLALPIPLLMGFPGWALRKNYDSMMGASLANASSQAMLDASAVGDARLHSISIRGLADGMWLGAWFVFVLALLMAVCRPGGLGEVHFRWRKAPLVRMRRFLFEFAVVYLPTLLITTASLYGDASLYFGGIGRLCFMACHAWIAVLVWQLYQGSDGIITELRRDKPDRLLTRSRHLWFPILLLCPIVLAIGAARGYMITVIEVSLGLVATWAAIAGGYLLYCLLLRWFTIRERRIALDEALAKRRARIEAAESGDASDEGELLTVDPEEQIELDLDSISEQTRNLLTMLIGLIVAIVIAHIWSENVPLLSFLDSIRIPLSDGLSLLRALQATLVIVITHLAAKNLPGLLELAVLRASQIETGTRIAILTLCRYAVIAIGLTVLLKVLNVDWAKFGWIAAALSVGIGFGLQEVVANFVCGLILLFERPVRVGDVVTVDGINGTVTKISMRATTITNWDRHDFVVPNKNLITGTFLNWTLTASLNRIVIPVGVAYGTNTEEARRILLDVAADHPLILDDPAPMATFEDFSDSSLSLILRAYLPNLDNRLRTMSELRTELDKRFSAAGIEIPFPQRDLHIRSGREDARATASEENGKKEPAP